MKDKERSQISLPQEMRCEQIEEREREHHMEALASAAHETLSLRIRQRLSTVDLFRELTPEEVLEFKAWARKNYEPLTEIKGIWHPVIQAECALMNDETHRKE